MIIFKSFTFIILVSSLSGQKEIDFKNLEKIDNIFFIEGENIPADGSVYQYRNGEKEMMGIMKNGKKLFYQNNEGDAILKFRNTSGYKDKDVKFIKTEGIYKYELEMPLNMVLMVIEESFNGDVEEWWENSYLDEEMDLISDNGSYDENIMYYVEDENGKFHDIFDYLNTLKTT